MTDVCNVEREFWAIVEAARTDGEVGPVSSPTSLPVLRAAVAMQLLLALWLVARLVEWAGEPWEVALCLYLTPVAIWLVTLVVDRVSVRRWLTAPPVGQTGPVQRVGSQDAGQAPIT